MTVDAIHPMQLNWLPSDDPNVQKVEFSDFPHHVRTYIERQEYMRSQKTKYLYGYET